MTDTRPTHAKGVNRRKFLADTTRIACGACVAGIGLGLYSKQAQSLPANALRPPGALPEEEFLAACVRCGLCVRDCPYNTLKLSEFNGAGATGTPYFVARDVPCEMCEDIPCVPACPTGALDPKLTRIDDARMGLAVLVDQETCIAFQGLRCEVCYRVCPALDKAISLERSANIRTGKHALFIPVVHSDFCTGCGKCERACILEDAAIKVIPLQLAKGQLGTHYRLGWKEKEQHGLAVEGIIDLPDRMPEAVQ
ncbi:MAG: ferredoxin-type protein NapG [Rhodospirillales bacterium]|nr:ferredoxin-type protein NapG [Rhodospirillales bacterium]